MSANLLGFVNLWGSSTGHKQLADQALWLDASRGEGVFVWQRNRRRSPLAGQSPQGFFRIVQNCRKESTQPGEYNATSAGHRGSVPIPTSSPPRSPPHSSKGLAIGNEHDLPPNDINEVRGSR
jgi:hypothetical protein